MMGWGHRSLCGEERNPPPGELARCQSSVTAAFGTMRAGTLAPSVNEGARRNQLTGHGKAARSAGLWKAN
ncbi:MAG: hypothetical protein WC956_02085 [bacterium]